MDLMYKEINYDLLNVAKIVYRHGIKGTLIAGDKNIKVFTALPEYYTMTDFDIHIQDSSEVAQTKEEIKALNMELIKAQQVDVETALEISTAKNLTDMKNRVFAALKRKKAENDQLMQMQQQLQQIQQQAEEAQKQIQQLTQENKALQNKIVANNEQKNKLDAQRIEIEDQARQDKANYNDDLLKLKEKQLEIERLQMLDGNPYNDKVRDT